MNMLRSQPATGKVTIKHEYLRGSLSQSVVTRSQLTFDNPATMRGLERMFALRTDERLVAVTVDENGITVLTEKSELSELPALLSKVK